MVWQFRTFIRALGGSRKYPPLALPASRQCCRKWSPSPTAVQSRRRGHVDSRKNDSEWTADDFSKSLTISKTEDLQPCVSRKLTGSPTTPLLCRFCLDPRLTHDALANCNGFLKSGAFRQIPFETFLCTPKAGTYRPPVLMRLPLVGSNKQ